MEVVRGMENAWQVASTTTCTWTINLLFVCSPGCISFRNNYRNTPLTIQLLGKATKLDCQNMSP